MRALDCTHPAHEQPIHATAENDQELEQRVRQHISEVHPDMSPDQARQIVAEGAYDEPMPSGPSG